MSDYGPIEIHPRHPDERLTQGGSPTEFSLMDFWTWGASDLLDNTARGVLAEFIVAKAVGDDSAVRPAWASWDLTSASGVRIEVKSAAYIQTWFQKKPSAINFSVGKHLGWNPEDGTYETEPRRHADAYVLALLATLDQSRIDPLDLDQWEFYVVPTAYLDARTRSQHSITLATLRTVAQPVSWQALATAVGQPADYARPAGATDSAG